jgi:hypothetical protein
MLLEPLTKVAKGGRIPMLCLNDSIRYDDPSLQRLLSAVAETHTLTARLVAVWPLARTLARHIVASVLAARGPGPDMLAPLSDLWDTAAE